MSDNGRLGRNQRVLLEQMMRHRGIWPHRWKLTSLQRQTMKSLVRRGLVEEIKVPTRLPDENMDLVPAIVRTWRVTAFDSGE